MNTSLPFPFPLGPEDILRRRAVILTGLLARDEGFCTIPVRSILPSTLGHMLSAYDERFFSGMLVRSFPDLHVTLSSRLTSAAGKFVYSRAPGQSEAPPLPAPAPNCRPGAGTLPRGASEW